MNAAPDLVTTGRPVSPALRDIERVSTGSSSWPHSVGHPASARDRLQEVIFKNLNLGRGVVPTALVQRLFINLVGIEGRAGRLLHEAGIATDREAGPTDEMATPDLIRLMRRVQYLTRDETWGLLPTPTRLGTFAQACHMAVHATLVGQGVRSMFRFYHGSADDFTLRLTLEGDVARISLVDKFPARPGRDIMHVFVLQIIRMTIEWLSGRDNFLRRVDLQHPPVPDAETLAALFGAELGGKALRTTMTIDRAILVRPIMADPAQIASFVASVPSKLAMVAQDHRNVADRAASYIRGRSDWSIDRDDVAAALNMSSATLRRRLQEDIGAGFQELKDRLRCAAALDLIATDSLNLEDVARMLGFAELSSFHRAFKRWTGKGPGAFRGQHQPTGSVSRNEAWPLCTF